MPRTPRSPGGLGGSQTLDVLLALGEWHGSVSDLRVNVFLEGICRPLREELLSAIDLEGLQFCVLIHLPSRHQALAMSRRLVAREMRPLKSPHVPVQLVDLVLSLELSRGGDRAQNLLDLLVLGGRPATGLKPVLAPAPAAFWAIRPPDPPPGPPV